jgi:hypothetical protein
MNLAPAMFDLNQALYALQRPLASLACPLGAKVQPHPLWQFLNATLGSPQCRQWRIRGYLIHK